MSRYIDADLLDDFLRSIGRDSGNVKIMAMLHTLRAGVNTLVTADVVEVRHGKWKFDNDGYYRCTCCNARARWTHDRARQDLKVNYCCNCGAKMDGREKE